MLFLLRSLTQDLLYTNVLRNASIIFNFFYFFYIKNLKKVNNGTKKARNMVF